MRRSLFGGVGLIVVAVVLAIAYFSVIIVDPTQQVLVLRFGEVVRAIAQPGLYVKLPLIDNAVYVEKRILDLDSPPLEIIAADQKRLVVEAFGRYRITDQLLFYQTVGSQAATDSRLSVIMNSAVRRVLGEASFIDVVRDRREQLMVRITEQVNREARRLGIDMIDVKIRRADLPEANSQAIYHRMQTERQREATEIRATGEQAARRIRAEADRDATVIVAEADKRSEEIRGDGDARRNQIFADAYSRDPDFFAFYRSMIAYQAGLRAGDTRLLLSPDSDFFRYFGDPLGRSEETGGASRVKPTVSTPSEPAAPGPADR